MRTPKHPTDKWDNGARGFNLLRTDREANLHLAHYKSIFPISLIREALIQPIAFAMNEKFNTKEIAVFLSSGVDSNAILISALYAGAKVTAYSFTLSGRQSTDFSCARHNANALGIPFVPIFLPVNLDALKADVLMMINDYKCKTKTAIECGWVWHHALPQIKEKVLLTGLMADSYFALRKFEAMDSRRNKSAFDFIRRKAWQDSSRGNRDLFESMCKNYGLKTFFPFRSPILFDEFMKYTWDELNKPEEKMPIRDAFRVEFSTLAIRKHMNFQAGDSLISKHFEKLLNSDWNTKGFKNVIGIYNQVRKGEITCRDMN